MKEENKQLAWNDLALNWKKLTAVIAGVGIITNFVCDIFNWPRDKVMPIFALMGVMIIILAWYVDRQAKYQREELKQHKQESDKIIREVNETLKGLQKVTSDTRKDTLRIQLSMYIRNQPENIDTILKLAEVYFVELAGDWYMTSEFMKWAKAHDVILPLNIAAVVNATHN